MDSLVQAGDDTIDQPGLPACAQSTIGSDSVGLTQKTDAGSETWIRNHEKAGKASVPLQTFW